MMIFVAVSRDQAEQLRFGAATSHLSGFSATPGLLRAHGLVAADAEDAAFTAQAYAMTWGLLEELWPAGGRVVLAVEAPASAVRDDGDPLGQLELSGFAWGWVEAVFSDGPHPDPAVLAAVAAGVRAVGGRPLAEAVDASELNPLIDGHDLLWHTPDEAW